MEEPPSFRGIFHASEDPDYWQEAMEEFPNKVPRFKNKEDTVNFIKTYCQLGSNPDEPHLRQSVTLMTTWSQIEQHLLPKIREYRNKWDSTTAGNDVMKKNRYMNGEAVRLGAGDAGRGDQDVKSDEDREKATQNFLKTTYWRRYKSEEGKIYYHNKSSKETVWKMPQILADYLAKYDANGKIASTTAKDGDIAVDEENCANEGESVSTSKVYDYLTTRLNLPIHQRMNHHSAINTLKYLFFHMRCGIYVMIRNSEVVIFAPFVNKDYRNNWSEVDPEGEGLKLESSDGKVGSYYAEKENHYRRENVLEDRSEWWANGNIICNEHEKPDATDGAEAAISGGGAESRSQSQYWGDQFLLQLKDMLAETCRERHVPDCEFFINKRDYPQLKVHEGATTTTTSTSSSGSGGVSVDMMHVGSGHPPVDEGAAKGSTHLRENMPVEPYGFIFDRDDTVPEQDIPLSRYYYSSYAPILSFYTSKRFADIPMPPSEDWESACGEIFPPSFNYTLERAGNIAAGILPELTVGNPRDLFTAANLKKFDTPWEQKVNTAFFRGTATGGGTTVETNQRLHVAQKCYDWEQEEAGAKAGSGGHPPPPLLDAKITGWNMRDKKIASRKMTFVRKSHFPFEGDRKKNFVEIYKQSSYKYLLYVEGHCAACRYGFMMQLGSVILKVDSLCVADSMWYFPLLKPYYDHVPVKADLSDLKEQIEWCRNNDEECRKIAARAKEMYTRFVSRDGILDYMQAVFVEISRRWELPLPFGDAPAALPVVTRRDAPGGGAPCCMPNCGQACEHAVCLGCAKIQEMERARQETEKVGKEQEKQTREQWRAQLKKRRREMAAGGGAGAGTGAGAAAGASPTKKARKTNTGAGTGAGAAAGASPTKKARKTNTSSRRHHHEPDNEFQDFAVTNGFISTTIRARDRYEAMEEIQAIRESMNPYN